jgi:multidrug efflux system outer membrane protein
VTYFLFYGCINLGPDYEKPDLGIQPPATFQGGQSNASVAQIEDRWWHTIDDPDLDQIVDAVLKNNWDLKQAAARILESRAQYVQVRANRFPEANIQGSYERRQIDDPLSGSGTTTLDRYDIGGVASFELDLWRRLAKSSQAAWQDILQQEEARRVVAQTLVAETIILYLQLEATERRLQIADQSITAFQRSREIVETRYKRGLVPVLDLRQASRVLAGAQALVPEFRQDLGILQQQISILLGRYPQTGPARLQPEDYYRPLPSVPAGLPSTLLLRRPDIRAAENNLKALNERVGAAKAARFPIINLTGAYGWSSNELRALIQPDNVIWNLTAGIAQPVFDAGRLKAGQRAAEARYRQGVADYVQTVLGAFAEVEGALLTRKQQLERRMLVFKFLQEARATQRVAQNRYLRGLTSYLDVLDAQQTRYRAEDDLVLADLTILSNWVELHRTLGGGWGEPEPVAVRDDGIFFQF